MKRAKVWKSKPIFPRRLMHAWCYKNQEKDTLQDRVAGFSGTNYKMLIVFSDSTVQPTLKTLPLVKL